MVNVVLPDGAFKFTWVAFVHVQVPAGITNVVVDAVTLAQAFCTSAKLQLAARIVCAGKLMGTQERLTTVSSFKILIIDDDPPKHDSLAISSVARNTNKVHCTVGQSWDRTLTCSAWQVRFHLAQVCGQLQRVLRACSQSALR